VSAEDFREDVKRLLRKYHDLEGEELRNVAEALNKAADLRDREEELL
jgi:hypothetical protein